MIRGCTCRTGAPRADSRAGSPPQRRAPRARGDRRPTGSREATREGARAFREGIEELGTTYIKLGQLLSSRPDLLPDVYIDELSRLVDSVPPVPFAEIEAVILEDFGERRLRQPRPGAARDRVDRPDAPRPPDDGPRRRRQGAAAGRRRAGRPRSLAPALDSRRLAATHSETAQLLQLEELADELEVHLRAELDFVEEAHNTELIAAARRGVRRARRAASDPAVRDRARARARVHRGREGRGGARARRRSAPPSSRAQFFRAYVLQVVVEGVYHADPHRGNILLTPDGRLALLDFGLLGRLDDDTRRGLSLLLLAIAQNRADDVADLILASR